MGKSDKQKRIKRSPCMGCEKREVGCHGKCEVYIDYQAQEKKIHDYRDPYADYIRKRTQVPRKFLNG